MGMVLKDSNPKPFLHLPPQYDIPEKNTAIARNEIEL